MSELNITRTVKPVPVHSPNGQSRLRVIPLGGVEEIGINCTVFEYKEKIVVVDMGLGFPDANMYGVDFVVPNVEYLANNKKNIEGIIITHGHLDHIGGLPYLLPRLDFPDIYGTAFTIELIKASLKDHDLLEKAKLHVITDESVLKSGDFEISFFRVNHSIPQCVGVLIETPAGKVVHTGDFKFDNSPVNEPVADYARIAEIGMMGVDLMLSDSTNSMKKGHPISESDVASSLESMMERAKGRLVVATFSGLVGRLYQLIQIAEKHNRKVAIAGYSMNQTLRIAEEIGYIKPKPGIIVPIQKINRYNDDRILILTTGAQGETNAALAKMASIDYKTVSLKKGDTVILSAGTIPGNNTAVQNLIESITSRGAIVRQSAEMDFFTSGHGYQEDQKLMLNLIKPKYFMPVHGYQYFLREHGRTGVQVGIKEANVIIAKRGQIIEGDYKQGFKSVSQIKATPLLVSGAGVGDIGASILAERQQLGNHGVVVIDVNINTGNRVLIGEPHVYTKGFVFARSSMDLITEIANISSQIIAKKAKKTLELAELRAEVEEKVGQLVEKETGRTPVILPMISLLNLAQKPPQNKQVPANQRDQRQRQPNQTRPHQQRPQGGPVPGVQQQNPAAQPQSGNQQPNQRMHPPQNHRRGNRRPYKPNQPNAPQQQKQQFAEKWNIPADALDLIKPEQPRTDGGIPGNS
jgi:ribonuclease J